MSIFNKIFGDANEKYLKDLQPIVEKINSLEPEFEKIPTEKLKEKTLEFKDRLNKGESLDNILPEAFAQVREAAKRTLKQRHFDVQLIGGIALYQGKVTEMKTGEGKTLVSTLPLYLNALEGKGCHLVTINDYLSRRDAVWMGQVFYFLGLSVGCLNHEQSFLYDPDFKSTSNEEDEVRDELGSFHVVEDFLRPCQRKEAYSADITYGTNNEYGFDYLKDNMVYDLSQQAQRGFNFAIVDEVDSILIDEARTPLIISAPDVESSKWYEEFARIIPKLDSVTDYEIDEKLKAVTLTEGGINKIENILGSQNIYEEKGIKYLHHLEQALRAEALFKKDKDYVVKDGQIIIVDEFTGRLMPGRRWSGGLHQAMEAKENIKIQAESLTLASITFQNYFRLYKKLSGMTGTAATSAEEFSKVYSLDTAIIPTHKPMVRKDFSDRIYKTEKGKIKALIREIKEKNEKGQPILVGTRSVEKNEYLGKLLEIEGIPNRILNAKFHEKEGEIIAQAGKLGQVTVATNMAGRGVDIVLGGNPSDPEKAQKVRELGGLHIIGTERHEARRIDNQLRGRSGRQGDSGSSQFFVSLEDDLMRIFGGDKIKSLMNFLKIPEDEPIEAGMVSKSLEEAQSKIEGMNFDARKHILDYDDVLNKHREVIYKKRKEILEKSQKGELKSQVLELIKVAGLSEEDYEKKEKEVGLENMRQAERIISLRVLDMLWMEHLENMEALRDSVRLRAYGHQDPLIEYKNEGHKMFRVLLQNYDVTVAKTILKAQITIQPNKPNFSKTNEPMANKNVGRNDPCPCGSGKKYKKCCGK
ncbi:preprotein translocase subunit SecA [Patescibacteria group bacterium]